MLPRQSPISPQLNPRQIPGGIGRKRAGFRGVNLAGIFVAKMAEFTPAPGLNSCDFSGLGRRPRISNPGALWPSALILQANRSESRDDLGAWRGFGVEIEQGKKPPSAPGVLSFDRMSSSARRGQNHPDTILSGILSAPRKSENARFLEGFFGAPVCASRAPFPRFEQGL